MFAFGLPLDCFPNTGEFRQLIYCVKWMVKYLNKHPSMTTPFCTAAKAQLAVLSMYYALTDFNLIENVLLALQRNSHQMIKTELEAGL